jgi:hypothetical protein
MMGEAVPPIRAGLSERNMNALLILLLFPTDHITTDTFRPATDITMFQMAMLIARSSTFTTS